MIVGGQTEARAQLSSTIIDYHEPFDQGFRECQRKIQNGGWFHSVHATKLEIWVEKAVPIWDRSKKTPFKASTTHKRSELWLGSIEEYM